MKLVEHEPFTSTEDAIRTGTDIHSETTLIDRFEDRVTVGDTDNGQKLKQNIIDLMYLLQAYRGGEIPERE